MSYCDQMAAALDGARTLTRLDQLSRSIWQGLAAGAVGDNDAQALAERLHAHRSLIRGDLKPVGLPWPAFDLPAQAAPEGSQAPCGDCPSPAPGGIRSNAAGLGVPV